MRQIPAASSVTFFGVNAVTATVAWAGTSALSKGLGLNWTGFALFLTGFAFFYAGNLLFLRLFLRRRPIPSGSVAAGSRTEYIHGVYQLFFIFFIAPISCSKIMPPPFTSLWYRFLGAHIGKNSFPSHSYIADPHFVTLGDEVTMGYNSALTPHIMMGDTLEHGRIEIGNRVTIGVNALIYGHTKIGDGALVLANSSVVPGTRIGENEMWGGNPAKKVKILKPGDRAWNGAPQTAPSAWPGEKGLEIARGV